MRKLGIWLALFFVTLVGVITGWNWHAIQLRPQIVETSFRERLVSPRSPQQAETPAIAQVEAPTINPDRVLADVEALAFKRYTEAERSRTREYIASALQEAGWLPEFQTFENGVNVVAERPGTDPSAGAILVAAHYDTVEQSPGADDNATGVAAVLETARLLGQLSTPRTLKLALFDLEEVGLVGSLAYAADDSLTTNLAGAIIMDMIGFACHTEGCQQYPAGLPISPPTDRGDFLAVIGDRGHMSLIDAFHQSALSELPQVLSLPIPLLGPLTPDLLRSDHAPFWQKGIGAVMVTDTANFRNPNYHQATDTFESLDRPFLTGATQLVVNATAALLSTPGSLTNDAAAPAPNLLEETPTTPL
jgi:Zn-dependent M28 family amino/carboxypeptidase